MYKTTITLKQHTPIIHFQHDQEGATLRATELKPKLDRFIFNYYSHLFKDDPLIEKAKLFDPNLKTPSLYKIKIVTKGDLHKILVVSRLNYRQMKALNEENVLFIQGVSFFAEEENIKNILHPIKGADGKVQSYSYSASGENSIDRWGVYSGGPIEMEVKTFNKDVKTIIENILPYFFVATNFGTRQNKGFGCFTLAKQTEKDFEEKATKIFEVKYRSKLKFRESTLREALEGQNQFRGRLRDEFNRGKKQLDQLVDDEELALMIRLQGLLGKINEDYQLLKTGKNFNGYKKSLLFLYGHDRLGIRWEKRKIKSTISKYYKNQNGFQKLYTNRGNSNLKELDEQRGYFIQSWEDGPSDHLIYKYLRLALGMSEQFEFNTTRDNGEIDRTNKYIAKINGHYQSKDEKGKPKKVGVERYQSPLTFKVFGDTIYLLANEPNGIFYDNLLKSTFDVEIQFKKKVRDGRGKPSRVIEEDLEITDPKDKISLSYPEKLKLKDFLKYSFETCPHDEKITGYKSI